MKTHFKTINYNSVRIEIDQGISGNNIRLTYQLVNSQGQPIEYFPPNYTVTDYSTQNLDQLIVEAKQVVDDLIKENHPDIVVN